MIQISQEELFRKIKQEHPVDQAEAEGEEQEGEKETLFREQDQVGGSRDEEFRAREGSTGGSCLRLVSGSKASPTSSATPSACRRQMSSILPRTTYGNLTKDPNNNLAQALDENEVQAVLVTGNDSNSFDETATSKFICVSLVSSSPMANKQSDELNDALIGSNLFSYTSFRSKLQLALSHSFVFSNSHLHRMWLENRK